MGSSGINAAKSILQRYAEVIQWRLNYLNWPRWLQNFLDSFCGLKIPQHTRLEAHCSEIHGFIQTVNDAIDDAENHLKYLDAEEEELARLSRSTNSRIRQTLQNNARAPGLLADRQRRGGLERQNIALDAGGRERPQAHEEEYEDEELATLSSSPNSRIRQPLQNN